MKAQICPNCSAADWKEVDGYQVCTYCGTKIPIPKEEQSATNSLVGKWVSNEVGEKDSIIIEKDLTGVLMIEHPPYTKTAKDLEVEKFGLDGYVRMQKVGIKLFKTGNKTYSILCNSYSVYCYGEEFYESGTFENHPEVDIPDGWVLIQLSENKILTLTEGDETILEKVE